MNRRTPLPDYYVRAIIKAELRRAERGKRPIDRAYLYDETGVSWGTLERRLSDATKETAARKPSAAAAGGASVPDPLGPGGRPFASPKRERARLC